MKARWRSHLLPLAGVPRLAAVVLAAVLIFGMVFGVGQAMADSLPGETLYNLKLLVGETRLKWTTDPEAKMDLALDLVGARLNEVATAIEEGQPMDEPTRNMVQKQLGMALDTMGQAEEQEATQTMTRHMASIKNWHRRMVQAMEELAEPGTVAVRELARETEQLRQELHSGQGEVAGEQYRGRSGAPRDPTLMPDPAAQPGPGPQATGGPHVDAPAGPGPQPIQTPAGIDVPVSAGPGPGPQPGPTNESGSPGNPGGAGDPGSGGQQEGDSGSQGGSPGSNGNNGGKGKP